MYKVFLVDDETIMCNGLINIVDWSSLGCCVCGTASNGVSGLQNILKIQPDIIISDICMPEMDGLEMIRKLKEHLPHCKIIIITAFREFDYVQEAVKLGAFDFILKPFKIKSLMDTIKRAVDELKFMESREEEMLKFKEYYEKSLPALREKCSFDLLIYGSNGADGQILAQECNFSIKDFLMIVTRISINNSKSKETGLYRFGVVKTLIDMLSKEYLVEKVLVNSKNCAFLFSFDNATEQDANKLYHDITRIINTINDNFGVTIEVGVSSWGNGISDLSSKYEECVYALEQIDKHGHPIMLFNDLEHLYQNNGMAFLDELQVKIIYAVQLGKVEEAEELVRSLKDFSNKELLTNFYITTYKKVRYIELSLCHMIDTNVTIYEDEKIPHFDNLTEGYDLLLNYISKTARQIQGFNTCKTNAIVVEAVKYMEDNFKNPITLNNVAEYVHVSMYYLSRLFSKQFNQTFSDYLTNIRINHAKELLRDSDYKAYEIGELVGISDPNYFSKCFKKFTGMTLTAYREKHKKTISQVC